MTVIKTNHTKAGKHYTSMNRLKKNNIIFSNRQIVNKRYGFYLGGCVHYKHVLKANKNYWLPFYNFG